MSKGYLDYEKGLVLDRLEQCDKVNCLCPYHRFKAANNKWVVLSIFHKELRRGHRSAYYWADRLAKLGLGRIVNGYMHNIVFEETQSLELYNLIADNKNIEENISYFLGTPKNWEVVPLKHFKETISVFYRLYRYKENSKATLERLIKNMDNSCTDAYLCIRYAASFMNDWQGSIDMVKQAMITNGMLSPEAQVLLKHAKHPEKEHQKLYYLVNRYFDIVRPDRTKARKLNGGYDKFMLKENFIPPVYAFDHHTHLKHYIEMLEQEHTYAELYDDFGIDLRWCGMWCGEYWRHKAYNKFGPAYIDQKWTECNLTAQEEQLVYV